MVRVHRLLFVPAILLAVLLINGGTPAHAQMFNNVWQALGKGKSVVEAGETSARESMPERFQGPAEPLPLPPGGQPQLRRPVNNVPPLSSYQLPQPGVRRAYGNTLPEPPFRLPPGGTSARELIPERVQGPAHPLPLPPGGGQPQLRRPVNNIPPPPSSQLPQSGVRRAYGNELPLPPDGQPQLRRPVNNIPPPPSSQLPQSGVRRAYGNTLPEPPFRLPATGGRPAQVSTSAALGPLGTYITVPGKRLDQEIVDLEQSYQDLKKLENPKNRKAIETFKVQKDVLGEARKSLASFDQLLIGGLNRVNMRQAEGEINKAVINFAHARSRLRQIDDSLRTLSDSVQVDQGLKQKVYRAGAKIKDFHASFAQELERRVSISTILSQQLARNPHQVVKIENIGPAGLEQLEGLDGRSQAFSRFLNSYPS